MLYFLPSPLRGFFSFCFYVLNTVFHCSVLYFFVLLKFFIPVKRVRDALGSILTTISSSWVSTNSRINMVFTKISWSVTGLDDLTPGSWYLVLANHQSWADIIVLQTVFNGKIPFLKFFLKKELIWVPFLGLAWWGLDFPFMKRYSKALLKRKPHLAGRDVAETRKACNKFKTMPVSIMNFVEGTRFTKDKHTRQDSPFNNLLCPKAGGIAYVLGVMGDSLKQVLDVTIIYRGAENNCSFWDFISGNVKEVVVHVSVLPVDKNILGNYQSDSDYRDFFQKWLNGVWKRKDSLIDSLGNE